MNSLAKVSQTPNDEKAFSKGPAIRLAKKVDILKPDQIESSDPKAFYKEAAKVIKQGFKTPGHLLKFLNEAIMLAKDWEPYKAANNKSSVGELFYFIKESIGWVVQPWFESEDDDVDAIAEGLEEFIGMLDREEYRICIGNLFMAYGYSLIKYKNDVDYTFDITTTGLNTLLQTCDYIDYVEMTERAAKTSN